MKLTVVKINRFLMTQFKYSKQIQTYTFNVQL